jgi:phenylacetate-CoA ligase
MIDLAAASLGCAVFPGGVGNTAVQAQAMRRFGASVYVGTPDYLRTILEAADEEGAPISTVKRALVSGGPLFPAMRDWYAKRGIRVQQGYGTADVGLIAYETEAMDGMVVEEDALVEIVRPGTGDPVEEGEIGEVVVTTFDPVYPMIRFATGDLSAVMPGHCPTGRTNMRLAGWKGRADQTTKVKGMFVHPEQVARVAKAHGLHRVRLEVSESDGRDSMVLLCEGQGDAAAVADTLQKECRLKGEVRFTGADALPNDGKVIDDRRAL